MNWQNENKQLKVENRTISAIVKLILENKCIAESKSSTDDDNNKREFVKSGINKTNKNISDPESLGVRVKPN